jgi:hypothetical protein
LTAQPPAASLVGRAPDDLTIQERLAHAGRWIALEIYSIPSVREQNGRTEIELKLRRIRAAGDSVAECIGQLEQAGLDPRTFEFTRLTRPY